MFKIGDLVKYKKSSVDDDSVGLVVKQNPIYKKFWLIQWIDGSKYQENEMHLEVVCK
tara:strand:- start:1433 stop:1603 length:171 start_codon:yes stop_codon:yes gene_type:complete